jgi:hypothetical protein
MSSAMANFRAASSRSSAHWSSSSGATQRHLGERGTLSQGVQESRKALRIPHIYGMEVREKMPMGFK